MAPSAFLEVFSFNVLAEFMEKLLGEATKRADPPTSAVKALNPRAGRTRGRRERKGDFTIPENLFTSSKEMPGNLLFNFWDVCLFIHLIIQLPGGMTKAILLTVPPPTRAQKINERLIFD